MDPVPPLPSASPQPEAPKPTTLPAQAISAIPPELRRQLHIVPEMQGGKGENPDADDIPPEVLAKVRTLTGQPESGEIPGGFSWAGLVYGPFYYWAMRDWLFVGLSTVASLLVYTLPGLVVLAFFARRRAWFSKKWESETDYWRTQKSWDRSAIVGAIFSGLLLYFVSRYMYATLSSTFGTTDVNEIRRQIETQYEE